MAYPTIPSVPANTSAPIDGQKSTYAAVKIGLVPVGTTPDDVFTITGSASKIVRVTRIEIYGTQATGGGTNDVVLVRRTTADSGGTSTGSPTIISYDTNNPSATATVLSYTANPTLGTALGGGTGALRSAKMFINVAATGAGDKIIWDFGNRPSQGVVLRGTGDVLAVNLNHVAITNAASLDIMVEWTEE